MFLEVLIGLVATLIVLEYFSKKRRNEVFRANGLTGPPVLPLIGAAHNYIGETPESMLKKFSVYCKTYGKSWRMWFGQECGVLTADPIVIEALLTNQQMITKAKVYDLLRDWMGDGLLLATGKKWHTRRKIVTPTFHFKILEQFVDVFDQQAGIMVHKLYEKADGKTVVDIFPIVCLMALDIITETAMGVKVGAQKDPNFSYVKSVTTVTNITCSRFMKFYQRSDLGMLLSAPFEYRKLKQNIKVMHDFTDRVIAERRAAVERSIANGTFEKYNEDDADTGMKKRMALLDVLLQAPTALTNKDIREEVDTFMFAGHDTTTSGISHTLYLIARHPEVQAKLFKEIREVIGDDKDKPISMRELQDLKYLDCVIKEALRILPAVPIVARNITADVNLNGVTIPADCYVVALIFEAQRDPAYFKNPETFDPERYGPNSTEKISPFANVPFSAGPRNCIGQRFAMLEMKSSISKVLRHFELLPLGESVKSYYNLVLRSTNGVNLGLKPRVYTYTKYVKT